MPRGRKARPASGCGLRAGRPPRIPSIVPAGTPVILSGDLAADLSYVVQQQQVQAARVRILLGPGSACGPSVSDCLSATY